VKNRALMTLVGLGLILSFQNCVSELRSVKQSSHASIGGAKGNGDSYTGKIYQNIALDGSCGGAGVRAQIEIDPAGQPVMVRENCQAIAAKVVEIEDLMPHNPGLLSHSRMLFQDANGSEKISTLLCRDQVVNAVDSLRNVVDATIYLPSALSQNLMGGVLIGQYRLDDASLQNTLQAFDKPVMRIPRLDGSVSYTAQDAAGKFIFMLNVRPSPTGGLIGNLTYVITPGSAISGGALPETVTLADIDCKAM